VFKVITRSLLVLSALALLQGCGKQPAPAPAAPASESPATTAEAAKPHPMPGTAAGTEVDLSGITKAEGGKTIAELYTEKDQLGGQSVKVRGKVVKVNANIMGKNWLHVRDGTGEENANDLTVTTTGQLPSVGDTVLVTGTVTLDKDYGMGYTYPVIIEDAQVTVE
jgi:hypothetical protein